ncbi:MAG: hypothetical protein R6U61_04300 [Thermoplasmata archaeon]
MTDIIIELGDEHYTIDMGQGFPIHHEIEFLDLIDTPESYVGQARLIPRVTGTEDGLEFYQPGIGDLDPKDHHLLDGLTDDDHPLYLRHDGQREITGNLIPDVDGAVSLGRVDREFSEIWTERVTTYENTLIIDTDGDSRFPQYHMEINPFGKLSIGACIEPMEVNRDLVMGEQDKLDWSSGKGFPRIYEGSVLPSMEDGEWGIWHDTGTGQYWIVLRKGAETHRVELKS